MSFGRGAKDISSSLRPTPPHKSTMIVNIRKELIESLKNKSLDIESQLSALRELRRLLSAQRNPPVDEVIKAGLVARLIDFLNVDNSPKLQFESAWCITNITNGTATHTRAIIDAGAIPIFIKLCHSPEAEIQQQVVWALGNIAGDSVFCRDMLLKNNVLNSLTEIISPTAPIPLLRNVIWTISNLCRGKPQPEFDTVEKCLPALTAAIRECDDIEVLTDACWALSYLSDDPNATNRRIQAVLDSGICRSLIQLLLHISTNIKTPALRAVGNIVTGDESQTQAIIDLGALPCLLSMLDEPKDGLKKEACWTISNITAGSPIQVTSVINAGLIKPLLAICRNSPYEVKKEAIWAVVNATSSGNDSQINELVHGFDFIPVLVSLFDDSTDRILHVVLDGIENVLVAGRNLVNNDKSAVNDYAVLFEEAGLLEKFEQIDEDHDIIGKMNIIQQTYFKQTEEKEISIISSSSSSSSLGFGVGIGSNSLTYHKPEKSIPALSSSSSTKLVGTYEFSSGDETYFFSSSSLDEVFSSNYEPSAGLSPRYIILAVSNTIEPPVFANSFTVPSLLDITKQSLNSTQINDRIRLPNIILDFSESDKASPTFAAFVYNLPLQKLILTDEKVKFTRDEAEISFDNVLEGDEWHCSATLIYTEAQKLEEYGQLFNVQFKMRGRVSGYSDITEVESYITQLTLTPRTLPTPPHGLTDLLNDQDLLEDGWNVENYFANAFAKLSKRAYAKETMEELSSELKQHQNELYLVQRNYEKMKREWSNRAINSSSSIRTVKVNVPISNVSITAEVAFIEYNPSSKIPIEGILITDSYGVKAEFKSNKVYSDRRKFEIISYLNDNDQDKVLPGYLAGVEFFMNKFEHNSQVEKIKQPWDLLDISVSLQGSEGVYKVETTSKFSFPGSASLYDWCVMENAEFILLQSYQSNIRVKKTISARIKCKFPDLDGNHFEVSDEEVKSVDLETPTLNINIIVTGSQLISAYNYLVAKRNKQLLPEEDNIDSTFSISYQMSLTEIINDYLPGLHLDGKFTLLIRLDQVGKISLLKIIDSGIQKESNSTFLGLPVLFEHVPPSPNAAAIFAITLTDENSEESSLPLMIESHPKLNLRKFLSGFRFEADKYIPSILLDKIYLNTFIIKYNSSDRELGIYAEFKPSHRIFIRKRIQKGEEENIFIIVYSILIDNQHFPTLPNDINRIKIPIFHPYSYVYSSSIVDNDAIHQLKSLATSLSNNTSISSTLIPFNLNFIDKISSGATIFTKQEEKMTPSYDYETTVINIKNIEEKNIEEISSSEQLSLLPYSSFSILDSVLTAPTTHLLESLCDLLDFNSLFYGLELISKKWRDNPLRKYESWIKSQISRRFEYFDMKNSADPREEFQKKKSMENELQPLQSTENESNESVVVNKEVNEYLGNYWFKIALSLQRKLNMFEYIAMKQGIPSQFMTHQNLNYNLFNRSIGNVSLQPLLPGCSKPHYQVPDPIRIILSTAIDTGRNPIILNDILTFYPAGKNNTNLRHDYISFFAEQQGRLYALWTGPIYSSQSKVGKGVFIKSFNDDDNIHQLFVENSNDLLVLTFHLREASFSPLPLDQLFNSLGVIINDGSKEKNEQQTVDQFPHNIHTTTNQSNDNKINIESEMKSRKIEAEVKTDKEEIALGNSPQLRSKEAINVYLQKIAKNLI